MTNERKIQLYDAFVSHIIECLHSVEDVRLTLRAIGLSPEEIDEILSENEK